MLYSSQLFLLCPMPGVITRHVHVAFESGSRKKAGKHHAYSCRRGCLILIVEDNADNLFIVTDILKEDVKAKYVNARASGRQLFKLMSFKRDLNPNLILSICKIPYEDGYTILSQLRAHPTLRNNRGGDHGERAPAGCRANARAGFDGFMASQSISIASPSRCGVFSTARPSGEPR